MNNGYVSDLADRDPWKILGVAPDSGPEEIRRAYLKKIKESPPDRAPEKFELIRDAYHMLRDPRMRARTRLFSADPEIPFPDLLDSQEARREFLGPGPWLAAMEK